MATGTFRKKVSIDAVTQSLPTGTGPCMTRCVPTALLLFIPVESGFLHARASYHYHEQDINSSVV